MAELEELEEQLEDSIRWAAASFRLQPSLQLYVQLRQSTEGQRCPFRLPMDHVPCTTLDQPWRLPAPTSPLLQGCRWAAQEGG